MGVCKQSKTVCLIKRKVWFMGDCVQCTRLTKSVFDLGYSNLYYQAYVFLTETGNTKVDILSSCNENQRMVGIYFIIIGQI